MSAYLFEALLFAIFTAFFIRIRERARNLGSAPWGKSIPSTIQNPALSQLLKDISSKAMIDPPELMVIGQVFKYGFFTIPGSPETRTATKIVVSNPLLSRLTENEQEAALGHELYHVKYGTTHRFVERVGLWKLLLALACFAIVPLQALVPVVYLTPGPLGSTFLVIPWLTVIPSALWAMTLIAETGALFPTIRQYEFNADWAVAILLGRPLELSSALQKVSDFQRTRGLNIPSESHREEAAGGALDLAKTLKPSFLKRENDDDRVLILHAIDHMLNSKVRVIASQSISHNRVSLGGQVVKPTPEWILLRKGSLVNTLKKGLDLTEIQTRIDGLGEENLRRIYSYSIGNAAEFNLKACSHDLGIDLESCLYGVFALVLGKVIAIVSPDVSER